MFKFFNFTLIMCFRAILLSSVSVLTIFNANAAGGIRFMDLEKLYKELIFTKSLIAVVDEDIFWQDSFLVNKDMVLEAKKYVNTIFVAIENNKIKDFLKAEGFVSQEFNKKKMLRTVYVKDVEGKYAIMVKVVEKNHSDRVTTFTSVSLVDREVMEADKIKQAYRLEQGKFVWCKDMGVGKISTDLNKENKGEIGGERILFIPKNLSQKSGFVNNLDLKKRLLEKLDLICKYMGLNKESYEDYLKNEELFGVVKEYLMQRAHLRGKEEQKS